MLSMNSDQFRRSKPSQTKRKNDTWGTHTTNGPTQLRSSVQILKSAISEATCSVMRHASVMQGGRENRSEIREIAHKGDLQAHQ
jgi:hypothetical protein